MIRGELLRYLRPLGRDVEPFDGCPEPWAAGIRGEWRAAADGWLAIGDPYEAALELAESGDVEPTIEALELLETLGAQPAITLVRERLRAMGVTRRPRRESATTRVNPAGLTERQLEILRLVGEGLSSSDIADRLVVSARTVDHHVAAALDKLGVHTRREAAARLAILESSGGR